MGTICKMHWPSRRINRFQNCESSPCIPQSNIRKRSTTLCSMKTSGTTCCTWCISTQVGRSTRRSRIPHCHCVMILLDIYIHTIWPHTMLFRPATLLAPLLAPHAAIRPCTERTVPNTKPNDLAELPAPQPLSQTESNTRPFLYLETRRLNQSIPAGRRRVWYSAPARQLALVLCALPAIHFSYVVAPCHLKLIVLSLSTVP